MNRLHSDIFWRINSKVEEAYKYDDDDVVGQIELTESDWNEVVVNGKTKTYYLHMPVTRFSEEVMIMGLPHEEITLRKLLTMVYEFYHTIKVTPELVKRREKDDVFNYIKHAAKEIKKGNDVHIIDIMGDKVFYEGFTLYRDILFLELGS
jgi:plasmid rolling circle replication initiator protein Rep